MSPTQSTPDPVPSPRPHTSRRSGDARRTGTGFDLGRSAGWTVLGTLVPGLGLIRAGYRGIGTLVLAGFAAVVLGLGLWALLGRSSLLAAAVDPASLAVVTIALVVLALAWVAVVLCTHLALRPVWLAPSQRALSAVLVAGLAFVVVTPMAVAARYSFDQAGAVGAVFQREADSDSATRPRLDPNQPDPWAGTNRLNVLLLGGDGGDGRDGVRTDTVMVASMDTQNGDTTLFSLPRNTARMPFPADSELGRLYPNGFYDGFNSENLEYVLFSMYRNVPAQHPGAVGVTDHEGADVMKVSVGEALGLDIDYYAMVNLDGFSEMIDALGGVTVNINSHVAVGGNTDLGIFPNRYLNPGPNQHLDGEDALWFARGRYGSDDFERMARQRCLIDAVIGQANPRTVLTRYEAIARASADIIETDIPQELLPALLELGFRVTDGSTRSVLFQNGSDGFTSDNPDWALVRRDVEAALAETEEDQQTGEAGQTGAPAPSAPADEPSAPDTSSSPAPSQAPGGSTPATPGPSGAGTPMASPSPTEVSESTADSCAFDPVAAAESVPGPVRNR